MPQEALDIPLAPDRAPAPQSPGDGSREAAFDDSRRSFLRMISHELRTPLNSVIGFSEIIERELHGPIADPRYKAHAALIHESGLRLLKLVNQVLEIARLDAGAADLDVQPEQAGHAARAAVKALYSEADARDVDVRVELDPATPPVMADPRALDTVLQNLLRNAIAHSPPGGEVLVRVRPARDSVVFDVIDQGPGVPPAELHRLSHPFIQGENPLVRKSEGAGLGLAIARLFCREMGGRLALNSALGRGLTARVRLPSGPSPAGALSPAD